MGVGRSAWFLVKRGAGGPLGAHAGQRLPPPPLDPESQDEITSLVLVICAQLCPTLCDPVDCSPPLSMGSSGQEYRSGLPFPSPGHLSNPGIEPHALCLLPWQADPLLLSHQGSPVLVLGTE